MKHNNLINKIENYYDFCLIKNSYIKPFGKKWRVFSHKGKNLGTYDTKEEANARLRQIEFFKWKKKASSIDLTEVEDLSYSAIMRHIRKNNPTVVKDFLTTYKQCFDSLVENDIENPADLSLSLTLKLFNLFYPLKLNIKKEANVPQLGDPARVGKYLADIIRFTLNRISDKSRPKSIETVIRKIYFINENELGNKKTPPSSSIGQSISFIKNVLIGQNPQYIRNVINNVVGYLRS